MELNHIEIAKRRPVWPALSDLFLDTDISRSRKWRIRLLAESPYSLKELEKILIHEVYPVCVFNLFCMAGEWAGFEKEWLESRILKHLRARRKIDLSVIARFTVPLMMEWWLTKNGVKHARA
jgi:hypothetical protein